jgi:hypothetical protein
MQSVDETVKESKFKLNKLKPTSLPEKPNTINTEQQELNNCGNESLTGYHKNSGTLKQQENHSVTETKPKQQNSGNTVLPEKHNTIKKVKVTVYITEESWEDFNTIYGKRILDKRKTDKGDLMIEAIKLLKEKETTRKT